jgi:hypothetical protein
MGFLYKLRSSRLYLEDLFLLGYSLDSRGRTFVPLGQGSELVRYTVHPLLVETCLRLVGALTPNNKRSYETTR